MHLAACLLVLAFALAGCEWLPTREKAGCLPKGKYNRDRHELVVGARCVW